MEFQRKVVELLFNPVVAHAWVVSELGVNVFRAPQGSLKDIKFLKFSTGQPLGFLSSWPLFTLCHHIIVWLAAEEVYPGIKFYRYALLGDDIVIGDEKVAEAYLRRINDLGVKVSMPKSLISDHGYC